ncbi:MAG: sodium/pantothenate symporter, partial [Candidatus Schmidhempelia sp.]|nr:sodium/pantothenate symporter [Candidatus Schmidhempelia sp.]
LGKKFAILARKYNAITISDMLYAHYKSRYVVWFASIAIIIASIGAMTVQSVGGARLLETAAGIPYTTGLLIFGITTVFYTAFGGFRASILNDAFQGVVMLVGAILLLGAVIYTGGGLSQIVSTLKNIDPALLTPTGPDNFLDFSFMTSFWVLVCFGIIGLPYTAVRCMAYKDSKALHRGIIVGTIIVSIIMLMMHLAGALGPAILPNLTVPDQIVPQLIIHVLPPFAAGVFIAAPLAAVMSTINAQLLQVSSVIIKDLLVNFISKRDMDDQKLTRLSVVITTILGILLLITAWNPPDMIIWLNLLALGGLEAVFLWPLVLGLYWEKANATGALASMISGACSYIILASFEIKILGFHPIVPTLIISLIAFAIGNLLNKQSQ